MKKLLYLFLAVLVITACKKDDDDDNNNNPTPPTFEEQLVGKYVFTSGTFNQPVTMINVPPTGDTVTFPQGADATLIVASVLLGDSPCDNPASTAIEMKSDFSLGYICIGEDNAAAMGTWSADADNNSMALNVSTDIGVIAIPITSVTVDDNGMSGNIDGLPVPIDISQPVGATNMQFASVAVTFTKI